MHHITEDTPPDMLTGAVDLAVRLPDGRDVHMSIERSTPMMDLLVQVTTAHKLRPSEHTIQALAMGCPQERVLPYKPNTPLGALDTQAVRVLVKGTRAPAPKPPAPPGHQPFETTFRLQVHLPRNQFCVIRVGKHVLLDEIMRKVCEEKNLDPRKYEFRHPANIDKVLDPKRTLNDYEITEVTVVHRGSGSLVSAGDIMGLQREEEQRRKLQKTAGGVLNLIFRRGRTSMGSGSVSSDTRSISPTQSDDSRSVTPPAVQPPQLRPPPPLQEPKQPPARPKPPQRKRRPAPKPPQTQQQSLEQRKSSELGSKSTVIVTPPLTVAAATTAGDGVQELEPDVSMTLDNGLTICHSRNSSDSSGYHEASILSENCNTTLPRRPKSTVIHTNNNRNNNNNNNVSDNIANSSGCTFSNSSVDLSKSTGNLTKMTGQSQSTMSLTTAGRKKKAPPPPPLLKGASSVANINTVTSAVPVVASCTRVEPPSTPDLPSLTDLTIPLPKPRTVKPQAPVPSPRKLVPTVTTDQLPDDTTNNNINQIPVNQTSNTKTTPESSKLRRESKFDTIGRKRGFQIGKSMLSMEAATLTDRPDVASSMHGRQMSESSSAKTLSSSSSSQNFGAADRADDLDIVDIEMFENKHEQRMQKERDAEIFHRIASNVEIHELAASASYQEMLTANGDSQLASNESMLSLRSVDSVPGFLGSAANIRKWGNVQELDDISCCSDGKRRAWLLGDGSDTESTTYPPTTPNGFTSSSRSSDVSDVSHGQPSVHSMTTVDAPLSRTGSPSEQSDRATPKIERPSTELVTSTPEHLPVEPAESREPNPLVETRNLNVGESVKMAADSPNNATSVLKSQDSNTITLEKTAIEEIPQSKTWNEMKTYHDESITNAQPVVTNANPDLQPQISRTQPIEIKIEQIVPQQEAEQVLPVPVVPQEASETELDRSKDLQTLDPLTITPKMVKKGYAEEGNDLEPDWQYTLPSPPTAFRDSSPTNFTDMTNYDTVTFNGLSADSVVTSPQLFEKLESIRGTRSESESVLDTKSETDTITSDGDNVTSQKSQELMTSRYLSLENLEKRKSLVLERELASLKTGDSVETMLRNQKNNLINEIEQVLQGKTKSATLSRASSQSREKLLQAVADSSLPNFTITTYDQPKVRLNIFEDDSVRSNVDHKCADATKRNSITDVMMSHEPREDFTLAKKRNSLVSVSTENIYYAKRNSVDRSADESLFRRPPGLERFKKTTAGSAGSQQDRIGEMVARSESFSVHKNGWSRMNPVKRSKSHVSLYKYKDESKMAVEKPDEGLHKSNSLFNVSGLQSLEVMRMILPKLGNTPPNSPAVEIISKEEPLKASLPKPQPGNEPTEATVTEPADVPVVLKKYHYGGPPAINLGTWTDRPKSQVSLKEDRDYKINNIATMKAKFSSQTNLNINNGTNGSSGISSADNYVQPKSPDTTTTTTSFPSVNIRVNSNEPTDQVDGKINIKINSDSAKIISNQSSNVIIKIGNGLEQRAEDLTQVRNENKLKDSHFYSRFLHQTTAVGYRKPLGNINGVDKVKPRPHSIAFDASCPDLSRVPIVRAVELKKPYKDSQSMRRTITQIIHDAPDTNGLSNGSGELSSAKPVIPVKGNSLSNQYRHSSVYVSSENINHSGNLKPSSYFNKPVTRGSSFVGHRSNNMPVVKGFRTGGGGGNGGGGAVTGNDSESTGNRAGWNQYGTLPAKGTQQLPRNVPELVPIFSQRMLKRTEHGFLDRVERTDLKQQIPGTGPAVYSAPPPPQMPKVTAVTKKPGQRPAQQEEPRDMLLESIRNFGGTGGLKTVIK